MLEKEKTESSYALRHMLLGGALASIAIFAAQEIAEEPRTKEELPVGTAEIACDQESVTVKFDPDTYDTEFVSGQVTVRAYNPENASNPSGFFIGIDEQINPKEYSVGVSSINEEGVTGLHEDFQERGIFSGYKDIDMSFEANQGLWFIDVKPEQGIVTVDGVCLDDPEIDTDVTV